MKHLVHTVEIFIAVKTNVENSVPSLHLFYRRGAPVWLQEGICISDHSLPSVSAAPCLTSLLQCISVKRHITTFERRLNDPHGGAQVRDNLYSMEDWHVNPWKHNRNRNTVVAGIGIPRPSLSISCCCWSC